MVFVDDELMLLGFYRKRFFVYNEDKKYEVLKKKFVCNFDSKLKLQNLHYNL